MMYETTLDTEELELLNSVENDEWQPIPQMEEAIQHYQQIAAAALPKSRSSKLALPEKSPKLALPEKESKACFVVDRGF